MPRLLLFPLLAAAAAEEGVGPEKAAGGGGGGELKFIGGVGGLGGETMSASVTSLRGGGGGLNSGVGERSSSTATSPPAYLAGLVGWGGIGNVTSLGSASMETVELVQARWFSLPAGSLCAKARIPVVPLCCPLA